MFSFVAGVKQLQESGVQKIFVDPCGHPEGRLSSFMCVMKLLLKLDCFMDQNKMGMALLSKVISVVDCQLSWEIGCHVLACLTED